MKEYIMADYDGGQKIGDLTVVGELVRCKNCNKDGTSKCAMAYWDMETGEITAWNRPYEFCSRGEEK